MTWKVVPEAIMNEVAIEQEKGLPRWGEVPRPGGEAVFVEYDNLTVGDCEQLVEHHTRKGCKAIARFIRTESYRTAKTAAFHMFRARLYRCLYLDLTGVDLEKPHEDQMPFPCVISRPEDI